MKKWRDWLRERWPHWLPFPFPEDEYKIRMPRRKGQELLICPVYVSTSLLTDSAHRERLADLIAADVGREARRAVLNR